MSGQYVCWETCQYVRLQVVGAPCWLGSLLLSLGGSEEQTNFPQPSLKMLKMASERFIHVVVYRSFSQNFLLGVPEICKGR